MPHPPERGRLVQKDRPFCIGHDSTPSKLRQFVSCILPLWVAAFLAPFKYLHCLVNRVLAANSQIPAEQALDPGTLVPSVGDQRHADLSDSEWQRVMNNAGAVARLHGSVE